MPQLWRIFGISPSVRPQNDFQLPAEHGLPSASRLSLSALWGFTAVP